MGVPSGPFRATLFLLMESRAALGIVVLPTVSFDQTIKPCGVKTGVTSTSSHSIGTFAALNIFTTDCDISGPIPSPGISVTK